MNKMIMLVIYLCILISIPLFEVIVKNYIKRKYHLKRRLPINICNGEISIHYLKNEGAMLGTLSNKRKILLIVTVLGLGIAIILSAYIWFWVEGYYFLKLIVALMASGSLSNSLERFIYHYVIDYFSFPKSSIKKMRTIVFNLADIAIFFGTFVFYLYLIYFIIEQII